jgi:hypothetical protein
MPTHSEALLEAYASCPPSARVYHTLEIWQSSFDQPARVVANVGDDMMLGIENGAPHDGGSMVAFIACPFTADYPEQCRARAGAEDPRRARRPAVHPGALSRISRQRSDRGCLWPGRIRADQRADDGDHFERQW